MRIVSFASIFLLATFLLATNARHPTASLNGVWMLSPAKSNFGAAVPPEKVVVRMERTGSRLATWKVTTDLEGRHLVYREYSFDGKQHPSVSVARLTPAGIVFPTESTAGVSIDEQWQVSIAGGLIIRRSITDGPRTVHQRLVLDPATILE